MEGRGRGGGQGEGHNHLRVAVERRAELLVADAARAVADALLDRDADGAVQLGAELVGGALLVHRPQVEGRERGADRDREDQRVLHPEDAAASGAAREHVVERPAAHAGHAPNQGGAHDVHARLPGDDRAHRREQAGRHVVESQKRPLAGRILVLLDDERDESLLLRILVTEIANERHELAARHHTIPIAVMRVCMLDQRAHLLGREPHVELCCARRQIVWLLLHRTCAVTDAAARWADSGQ